MVVLEVSTLGDPFRFFRQHRMESVKKGNVRNQKLEIRNEESEIMCGRMVFGRNDSSRVHFHTFSLFNNDNIAFIFRFPTPTYTYRSDSNIISPSIA